MDFLTFKSFISIEALILFYYLGAFVMPVGMWFFISWLIRRYRFVNITYESGRAMLWQSLNIKQKIKLAALFIFCFLLMELFWRMLFEFLIAYMQMRDAILNL